MIEPLHVEMTEIAYHRLPVQRRPEAWLVLIQKAGVTGPYLPIPYHDEARHTYGMNIVRLDPEEYGE